MYSSTLPSTSVLDGVGGQRHAPAALPPVNTRYPTVQEAGWATGPGWTGEENLASTGIRSPDRPTRSKSLHRLRNHTWENSDVFNAKVGGTHNYWFCVCGNASSHKGKNFFWLEGFVIAARQKVNAALTEKQGTLAHFHHPSKLRNLRKTTLA